MTSLKFDDKTFKIIADRCVLPFKKSRTFFKSLGTQIDRDTKVLFREKGAIPKLGFHKWIDYGKGRGVQVYRNPNTGKWAKRKGTDGTVGKYGYKSRLLQKSGMFKKSWGIISLNNKSVKFGTNHKLADAIMSNPTREVLKFNNRRYEKISDLFYRFVDSGIKL